QRVAIPQRNIERLGQCREREAARNAPSPLDKADLFLGYAAVERQIELALAAHAAPMAQQYAEFAGRLPGHPRIHHTTLLRNHRTSDRGAPAHAPGWRSGEPRTARTPFGDRSVIPHMRLKRSLDRRPGHA